MSDSDDFDPIEILQQIARDLKTPAEIRLKVALILSRKQDEQRAKAATDEFRLRPLFPGRIPRSDAAHERPRSSHSRIGLERVISCCQRPLTAKTGVRVP